MAVRVHNPIIYILKGACFLLHSCGKTHRLAKEDLAEMPYEVGDTLVFRTSSGIADTLFILKIDRYINPTDPLDFFPTKVETMHVGGEITLRNPFTSTIGQYVTRQHINLLKLKSGLDEPYFDLSLYQPRDTIRYWKGYIDLETIRSESVSRVYTIDPKG